MIRDDVDDPTHQSRPIIKGRRTGETGESSSIRQPKVSKGRDDQSRPTRKEDLLRVTISCRALAAPRRRLCADHPETRIGRPVVATDRIILGVVISHVAPIARSG